jgi:hypothetical protein
VHEREARSSCLPTNGFLLYTTPCKPPLNHTIQIGLLYTPLQYVSKVLTFGLLHMLLAIFVFDYLQVVVVYKLLQGLHNVGVP